MTMVLTKMDSLVKTMLSDTILALCRNTLSYKAEVTIEGLLGITIDNEQIFLVNMNETIQKEGAAKKRNRDSRSKVQGGSDDSESESSQDDDSNSQRKRKRKRKRRKSKDSGSESSKSDNETATAAAKDESDSRCSETLHNEDSTSQHDSQFSNSQFSNIKSESGIHYDDEDDIVFVKEEPRDNNPGACAFGGQSGDGGSQMFPDQTSSDMQLQELALQLSSGDMGQGNMVGVLI